MEVNKQDLSWLRDIINTKMQQLETEAVILYNEGLLTKTEMEELQTKNEYALEHVKQLKTTIVNFIKETNKLTEK